MTVQQQRPSTTVPPRPRRPRVAALIGTGAVVVLVGAATAQAAAPASNTWFRGDDDSKCPRNAVCVDGKPDTTIKVRTSPDGAQLTRLVVNGMPAKCPGGERGLLFRWTNSADDTLDVDVSADGTVTGSAKSSNGRIRLKVSGRFLSPTRASITVSATEKIKGGTCTVRPYRFVAVSPADNG